MEVRLYYNSRRPGIGLKPKRESQRPLLPQHSRHCPVLEAGSAVGFFVYPPLEPNESYHIEYLGEGQYRFVYFVDVGRTKWEPVFSVTVSMPIGSIGMMKEDVAIINKKAQMSREAALGIFRAFVIPEDLGTPPGAVALAGATNFQTPPGWDTVYTSIFNMIERPVAPMLVVRVETDWYAHETEFRYVLQPGEGITLEPSIPIGQVLFVPREEVAFRDCSSDEIESLRQAAAQFSRDKAAHKVQTPYGMPYSPEYLKQSRA